MTVKSDSSSRTITAYHIWECSNSYIGVVLRIRISIAITQVKLLAIKLRPILLERSNDLMPILGHANQSIGLLVLFEDSQGIGCHV